MKTLTLYYSHSGNNRYLANRIAAALHGDCEELRPAMNLFPLQILFSLLSAGPPLRRPGHSAADYDAVILCGPLWMGRLAMPLVTFINRYGRDVKKLYLASCCGSDDEHKNDRFGYAPVFAALQKHVGDRSVQCEAFPIGLVLPPDKRSDDDAMMKARLSDENFTGEIRSRFEAFIVMISGKEDCSTTSGIVQ